MSRTLIISNFILFQLAWFACVLGGANHYPWLGTVFAIIVLLGIHLIRATHTGKETILLLSALLIGICFESLLVMLQLTTYPSGTLIQGFAPHWMIMMWPLFASTLNVSMRWIKALHIGWVALLGAVLAPLSYMAGNRLQAVEFSDPTTALLTIGLGWGILLPLLVIIANRYDGYTNTHPHSADAWRPANV